MLTFGVQVQMPDFSRLDPETVIKLFKFYADEIGQEILTRIEDRTPVDTGALKEDETYGLIGGESEIISWYVGTDYQEAEWKRVYAQYQEGPPLGTSTYTNGPHQMFFQVATADLALIQAWADKVAQEAVDNMVSAAGGTP